MSFDPSRYPANWKTEIRPRILARDENCCKFCAVHDRAWGYRDEAGTFHELATDKEGRLTEDPPVGKKILQIVLTVAHLDHLLIDHSDENLVALCQRCHLNYDRPSSDAERQKGRRYGSRAKRKSQFTLPL